MMKFGKSRFSDYHKNMVYQMLVSPRLVRGTEYHARLGVIGHEYNQGRKWQKHPFPIEATTGQ
jgi:hypothetical protein